VAKTPYDIDLDRNPANFQPLTPLTFLERSASVFPDRTAIGTSLAAIGITALAGTIRYAFAGDVEIAYAALVGVPAALGAVLGASLQQRLNRNALRFAFAALLVVVAGLLLFT